MRYKLFVILAVLSVTLILPGISRGQNSVDLEASIGRFYFSASGIVSPYASVVMTSQDYFLSSTVADEEGRFYLPEALVNDGFNSFCLEAVDIRRIGTSYTCFEVDPPERDYSKDEIFLPPTVGLSGRKIEPNSSITASGYTMPGSTVDVRLGEGYGVEAQADLNGYYSTELTAGVPPGKYELYATAVYGAKISEKPTRTFTIEVLGLFSLIPSWLIWLILILLTSIVIFIPFIILWRKRRKDKDKAKKPKKKTNLRQKLFFWRA